VKLDEVQGERATKAALLQKFQSGQYDVIHYAGHAFFDEANPARSGLLCHGREVLSGADLATIGNLPSLVFFNACEAGRIRGVRRGPGLRVERRIERSVGFAEAFMRGGVANFVGTYWPVGDAAASRFADVFYSAILGGKTLGAAITEGRLTVRDRVKSVDWADYIHYGDHDFMVKEAPEPGEGPPAGRGRPSAEPSARRV
jgi:CHAT domain-containing protein